MFNQFESNNFSRFFCCWVYIVSGLIMFIYRHFENRILLKLILGLQGVRSFSYLISGHEKTQSNHVCYFRFLGVLLASKEHNISEFIYLHCVFFFSFPVFFSSFLRYLSSFFMYSAF